MDKISTAITEAKLKLIAESPKDSYKIKRALLPKKVTLRKSFSSWGGSWVNAIVWPGQRYIRYDGEKLHINYKCHVFLEPGEWFPGIERNPFLVFHPLAEREVGRANTSIASVGSNTYWSPCDERPTQSSGQEPSRSGPPSEDCQGSSQTTEAAEKGQRQ